jgi:putative transcriptional regulator
MKNLQKIRKQRKLRREDLASKAGVSYGMVYALEADLRNATIPLAVKLADVLNVSLDELAGRKFPK